MSEQLRESVSALMDGEANELELRRVLAHEDKQLIDGLWSDYHRTQSVVKGDFDGFSSMDIAGRVSAALETESAYSETSSTSKTAWFKPLSGIAVAASVAFMVVFGVRQIQPQSGVVSVDAPTLAATMSGRAYPAQSSSGANGPMAVSAGLGTQQQGPGQEAEAARLAEKQLDKYILRHTETLALQGGQGVLPFARVANYEVE